MRKRSVKHYSSEEWVDFAMDQTPQPLRAEMQRHLDSGCEECAQLLGLWTRVGQLAHNEQSLQPPDSAVRHVQAAFSQMAQAKLANRMPLIPRLAFDSLWQFAVAGTRSGWGSPRKLLYKARDISIEVHIEPENKSERVNLTGQISISSLQGQALPGIRVMISRGEGEIASTVTNGFGEFHLSYVPEENLQISFVMANGETAVIPLSGPAHGK
jgi:hypothetical protein